MIDFVVNFLYLVIRWVGAIGCIGRGHKWRDSSWIWSSKWPFPWTFKVCNRCGRGKGYPDGSRGWEM